MSKDKRPNPFLYTEEVEYVNGPALRQWRRWLNITLEDFAEEVGVTHAYIAQIETKKQRCKSKETIRKICSAIERIEQRRIVACEICKPERKCPDHGASLIDFGRGD